MHIPEIEKEKPERIKYYQESRLPELMEYLNARSPFYREMFKTHAIHPGKVKTLEDLARIPVTTKDDLQSRNEDFLCVDKRKVVDFITTSGTMGSPVTFAMTDSDLERLAYNEYISFSCADATDEDIYQLMVTLDKRFMAGLAYFLGLRKMGAGIIRTGPGLQELQFESMQRFSPTGLITVPSFLPRLIQYAKDHGIDLATSTVRKAVCIGEPIRNPDFSLNTLGRKITENWDIKLYSTYASTEMGTAFTECREGIGGHHHPEMIIVEFLDEKDMPVAPGEAGEVTITTLGVEGMPLLRFKTGDICHHHTEPCACGRKTMRLGPVIGRKQQMIKFKGTTLYPPAIYDVLNQVRGIENYIVEVSTNLIGTDELMIIAGSTVGNQKLEKEIKDHFRATLRVAPEISFVHPSQVNAMQFPGESRKPIIFIDKRKHKN